MITLPQSVRRLVAGAVLGCGIIGASVSAQESTASSAADSNPENERAVNLPAFTVSTEQGSSYESLDATSTSRIREDIVATPASISVVPQPLIEDLGPDRLYDAMRYMPGVTEANSPNISDRVTLRGFASNSGEFLDGIGYFTSAQVDPIVIDRIEILGGPNGVLAPNGLPGGTINVVTKSPMYQESNRFDVAVGRYYSDRSDLDMTGPIGKGGFAYRLVASYQDEPRMPSGELKQTIIFPSLSYRIGRFTITYKLLYVDWDTPWEGSVPINPSSSSLNKATLLPGLSYFAYPTPPLYRTAKIKTHNLFITGDLTNHIAMRLQVRYQDLHSGDDSVAIGSSLAPGGQTNPLTGLYTPGIAYGPGPTYTPMAAPQPNWANVPYSGTNNLNRIFTTTIQNDYVAKWDLPWTLSATSITGWQSSEIKTANVVDALTTNNVNIYDPIFTTMAIAPSINSETDARALSAYYIERLVGFNRHVSIDLGGQATANRSYSRDDIKNAFTNQRGNTTTWLGSVMYMFTPSASVYASYSENGQPVSTGLPLAPIVTQFGKQNEVGLKDELLNRRLRLTAAYYDITETNFAVSNYAANTNPSLPPKLLLNVKSRGEELAVDGQLTQNIDIVANYDYNHIRDPLGRRQRGVADNSAAGWVSYTWKDGMLKNLNVNFGCSYLGSRAGDTQSGITAAGVPIQPTYYLPPLFLTRAGAGYTIGRYDFRLSLDNLANKEYLFGSSRTTAYQGVPFNVTFETGVKF